MNTPQTHGRTVASPSFQYTRLASSLHFVILGLGCHGAAHAQAAVDTSTLPEVRVRSQKAQETPTGPVTGLVARRNATATKTDTPIIETPQSVSVVTRDQMDAQNVQSVSEALRYSAGVQAEANGPDPRADVSTIRGFSAGGRSAYRDGLRDYAFGGQGGIVIEPYGLERVELLRGPSSVLYGQSDAGGTINLITKRPSAEMVNELALQVGSHNRKQAALDLGGAFATAPDWTYRLTGLVRDSDTQIDHVKDDRLYIAPALKWQPSSSTSVTFLSSYQKNERGQGYQALPRAGTLDPNANGRILTSRFVGEPGFDRFDQERASIGYEIQHQLNQAWTLRQNLRYTEQDTKANSIYQAGFASVVAPAPAQQLLISRRAGKNNEHVANLLIDNQAQWKIQSGEIEQTVLFGLDHQRLKYKRGSVDSGISTSFNVFNPVYGAALPFSADAPAHTRFDSLTQTGVYAQDQIKFNDRIAWTIGGRHDTARSETTGSPSQTDEAFTWRTGLVYLLDNGWAPYVGYAKSFLPVAGMLPETGEQYEIGIRYQPKDQPISFLASVYDLRRQNLLNIDASQLPQVVYVQTGEVRSRGLELEAKATLWRDLDLMASYAYNPVKVTRSEFGDQGKTPNTTPKSMGSLWAMWRVPSVAGLKLSLGARHIGSTFGDDVETLPVPSYTLVDAAIELDLARSFKTTGDWKLAFNVSNLTDKTYVATCGYYGDGCKYGYRRNAALTLTHRW